MTYYSYVFINYEKKELNYEDVLNLFMKISKKYNAVKLDCLAVLDTYFDEKDYQRVRKGHEYKKNIEKKISKITDEYNLYGLEFETSDKVFRFNWNKEFYVFNLLIDSNDLIDEQIIKDIIDFISDELLIECTYDINGLNKKC